MSICRVFDFVSFVKWKIAVSSRSPNCRKMVGKQKQDKIDKKNEKLPADRISKVADKRYNNISV